MLFLASSRSGKAFRVTKGGREYLVAPMTLLVPGVLNGSAGPVYYSSKEIRRDVSQWNKIPIVVTHPVDEEGDYISANEEGVLDNSGIGFLDKVEWRRPSSGKSGRLHAEGWFDVEDTNRVDPRILKALEKGQPIELSTGLFADTEEVIASLDSRGRGYSIRATNLRADHLAVLPDEIGACSIADGCGVLVNCSRPTNSLLSKSPPLEAAMTVKVQESNVLVDNYDRSLEDKRQDLSQQLDERFGNGSVWMMDVYEDYIVYSKGGKHFRLDYTEEDGTCVLSDEKPTKVRRTTVYEPIENSGGWAMSLNAQQRGAIIEKLVANCDCWKGSGDREVLNTFTDEKLLQLEEHAAKEHQAYAIANAAIGGVNDGSGNVFRISPTTGKWEKASVTGKGKKPTSNAKGKGKTSPDDEDEDEEDEDEGDKVTSNEGEEEEDPPAPAPKTNKSKKKSPPAANSIPRPRTADEWFRHAPPDVQNTFRYAQSIEQRERESLVAKILANSMVPEGDRPAHREWLMKKNIDELSNTLSLMPKAPAPEEEGGGRQVRNRGRNRPQAVAGDDDMLVMPKMTWEEVNEDGTVANHTSGDHSAHQQPSSEYSELSEEDWFQSAPAHIRNRFMSAVAIEEAEKRKMVEEIINNASMADDAEEERVRNRLLNKSVEELRDLRMLTPRRDQPKAPSYFGQATPLPNIANARGQQPLSDSDDILPLPKMDFVPSPSSKASQRNA